MKSIIRNFIAKQMAGRSDDGIMITLRDPQKVELAENIMMDLLMRNGFNPADITSEAQLKTILNQIEAMTKQSTTSGIRNTQSAKVFDLKGKEIPKGSKIMGGQADDMPPPGSRGGPDDIAAPVQSSEETLKNMIMAENKKNIAAMKKRKMLDDAIDNVSPGLTGDRKYDADIVAEDLAERMGLVYDDMPTKERLDLYDQAYTGLSKRRQMQRESLEDFVDDAGGVDESDPRGIDDFIPDDDPEPLAKGGIARIGLKDGMNRRTFLKLLGGAMSIPIIGKIFKPLKVGKTVTKVPIIKTDNVAGKPEWFDQLVNKVILEGDDVTKRFATKDREIVHMKVLDEGTGGKEFPPGTPGSDDISIMVTQDLDAGAVRVEYRNPENMYGDPIQLRYKKPNPDEGDPRPSAEFDTAESIPVARADGPDDYAIDIDEGGGQSIKDLTSDVSKLKEYATGQKPTLKEFVQSKKRKDKARAISQGEGEAESDFIINRQGEEIVEYPEPDFDDAFASGGIARMLGE